MKKDFIPGRRSKLNNWEKNFLLGLTDNAAALGISATQLAAITDQVNRHRAAFEEAQMAKTTAKSKVSAMQTEQVRTVRAIRKMVRQVKASPTYSEVVGRSMGIIGPEIETELTQPTLKVKLEGSHPVIRFRKGHSHGVFIYSRRGDEKQLSLLGISTRSTYKDDRPYLDPSKPEVRYYAAYYMLNDKPIGVMGSIASVAMGATT